tara:strand:- start:257 stop:592 length:336 start_codon:yes stop_codon:yes gene_type:complete
MKSEIKKLYYSIGEVSKIVGLKSYVLRYWETEFKQLTPPKNRAGNRTYRQKDINTILEIKNLLHGKKFTIEGARAAISSKVNKPSQSEIVNSKLINSLKNELREILQIIKK